MPKKASPHLKVEAVVVCDDIRREFNGKEILIGVYGGIIVPRFPANLNLAFWIQFRTTETGEIPIFLRLVGPHDVEFFQPNFRAASRRKDWVVYRSPLLRSCFNCPEPRG